MNFAETAANLITAEAGVGQVLLTSELQDVLALSTLCTNTPGCGMALVVKALRGEIEHTSVPPAMRPIYEEASVLAHNIAAEAEDKQLAAIEKVPAEIVAALANAGVNVAAIIADLREQDFAIAGMALEQIKSSIGNAGVGAAIDRWLAPAVKAAQRRAMLKPKALPADMRASEAAQQVKGYTAHINEFARKQRSEAELADQAARVAEVLKRAPLPRQHGLAPTALR